MFNVVSTEKRIFCPLCQEYNKFLRVQSAATLIDVSRRTIYRYLEEGKIYSVKTPGGTKRVCGGCLVKPETGD